MGIARIFRRFNPFSRKKANPLQNSVIAIQPSSSSSAGHAQNPPKAGPLHIKSSPTPFIPLAEEEQRRVFEKTLYGQDIHIQQELLKHPEAVAIFYAQYAKAMEQGEPFYAAEISAFNHVLATLRIEPLK